MCCVAEGMEVGVRENTGGDLGPFHGSLELPSSFRGVVEVGGWLQGDEPR
jgi:hypothetical protein